MPGPPEHYHLHLGDREANELRLLANDCIDKLWRHRKQGQLRILQIQIERALAAIADRDTVRAAKTHDTKRRSKDELRWVALR